MQYSYVMESVYQINLHSIMKERNILFGNLVNHIVMYSVEQYS